MVVGWRGGGCQLARLDRNGFIVLLLKVPFGLLCLQQPHLQDQLEDLGDPIRESPEISSERAVWYAFQVSVIFPHRDALRCQSYKSWKQPAWWTAALYLQANWRVLPWLSQGLDLLSGEQFEPSSSPSHAASLDAHLAQNQEPPSGR